MTQWELHGTSFGNCNCIYSCPCQFNALPDKGTCEASVAYQIDSGHYGDVDLAGVKCAAQYAWPGAVHEGNGTMQLYFDSAMSEAQRKAMHSIMTGGDTDEMATMWAVFDAMCPTKHEPVICDIAVEIDVAARRAKVVVTGGFESTGRPILNPVTGMEHRVRIDMPMGFEYRMAEIGSGSTTSSGRLAVNNDDTYGQFNEVHLSGSGVIDAAA